MDNPQPIAPLMTKLAALREVYSATHSDTPTFVICNQFTAQSLASEAQAYRQLASMPTKTVVAGLDLVMYPLDTRQEIVMEVR